MTIRSKVRTKSKDQPTHDDHFQRMAEADIKKEKGIKQIKKQTCIPITKTTIPNYQKLVS
jgi:hypothetical protein